MRKWVFCSLPNTGLQKGRALRRLMMSRSGCQCPLWDGVHPRSWQTQITSAPKQGNPPSTAVHVTCASRPPRCPPHRPLHTQSPKHQRPPHTPSTVMRVTCTGRVCPMRCARSMACSSTVGLYHRSARRMRGSTGQHGRNTGLEGGAVNGLLFHRGVVPQVCRWVGWGW